jgi:hypothetical protein
MKNPHAIALGRMARGHKKTMTDAAVAARRENGQRGGRPVYCVTCEAKIVGKPHRTRNGNPLCDECYRIAEGARPQ